MTCASEKEAERADDDAGAGRRVGVPGDGEAERDREHADDRGHDRHALGRAGQLPGRGRRDDQHRGDEQDADDLHGSRDDQGDEQHQDEPEPHDRRALGQRHLVMQRGEDQP